VPNHDFVGRDALEKEVANPRRKIITLEWSPEDILDVHASQFRPGEPDAPLDPRLRGSSALLDEDVEVNAVPHPITKD
jgi:hypothetical protein